MAPSDNDNGNGTAAPNQKEFVQLGEKLMMAKIKEKGEGLSEAISSAIQYEEKIMAAQEDWKPFEAIELLLKTFATSTLSLGPAHYITKQVKWHIGNLTSCKREVAYK